MFGQRFLLAVVFFSFLAADTTAGSWRSSQIAGMSVLVYVPDGPPKLAGKRAVMVCLHGCGQTNQAFKQRGNWKETAEEYGMVVALPNVPGGGVILGCWDYYGEGTKAFGLPPRPRHTRENRHNGALLSLVRTLLADESLNLDRNQVYLSGLSSGGGQTMVLGCLAPDIFAGIGINAGPTVGTGPNDIGFVATNLRQAKARCLQMAGDHRAEFATQVTSVIYGTRDTICNTGYNELNAEVMAELYGASQKSTLQVGQLPGYQPQGTGTLWSDARGPRVSLIAAEGMGHAWPAGSGPGSEQQYIASEGVNYPAYVTEFFFQNNRRINEPPSIQASVAIEDTVATVSGTVIDSSPVDLSITIQGIVTPLSETRDGVGLSDAGQFREQFGPLPEDNLYRVTLEARDSLGGCALVKLPDFPIGDPSYPPIVEEVTIVVDRDCVQLHGRVSDPDDDLSKVLVQIDQSEVQDALLRDYAWTMENVCGLAAGEHAVVVTAVDAIGLRSHPATESFQVAPPYNEVTDTLTGHTIAQRFRFYAGKGYGAADATYLELFRKHGAGQAFPLYGFEGRWYADSSQLQADIASDVRLRNRLIDLIHGAAPRPEALAQPEADSAAVGQLDRLPLMELIKMADQQGISLFDGAPQ